MNRTLVAALIAAALTAAESIAQRIEVGVGGFQPLAQTQTQFSLPYLVLVTSGQSGGAQRCFDLAGPLVAFGGIGFVPNLLANGQLNRGRGTIGITPFTGLQCTGAALAFVPATPSFDDSTPRDVEFAMTFKGEIPPTTRSIRFEIRMATTSENPFQLCFREPWMTLIEGAPDLDPDIEVYAGALAITNFRAPDLTIRLQHRLRTGDSLPRGMSAVFIVYVMNHGTWVATDWTAELHLPAGWKREFGLLDCADFGFNNPHTHRGQPLPVGETVRLCTAFRPDGATTADAIAITFVADDSNPFNDRAFSSVFDVEPPRVAQPLEPPILPLGGGRRR